MTSTAVTPRRPSSSRSTAFSTRSTCRRRTPTKLRDMFAPYVGARHQGRPRRRGRRRPGRPGPRRRHRRPGAEQGDPGVGQEGRQGHLRPGPDPAGDRGRVPREGRRGDRAGGTPRADAVPASGRAIVDAAGPVRRSAALCRPPPRRGRLAALRFDVSTGGADRHGCPQAVEAGVHRLRADFAVRVQRRVAEHR